MPGKGSRLLIGFSVLALLTVSPGCVVPLSGYVPQQEGPLESGRCVAGIEDILRMSGPKGLTITIRAGENTTTKTITLNIELALPDKVAAQFSHPVLELTSTQWAEPIQLPIEHITGGAARYKLPTDILIGSAQEPYGHYLLWFIKGKKGTLYQTPIPVVPNFTLAFPSIRVDGEDFVFRAITFQAYEKWGVGFPCV